MFGAAKHFAGGPEAAFLLPAQDVPTIPIHVAAITERSEVAEVFTDENIRWIVDNLNQEFRSGDGTQLLRFELKAVTKLADAREQAPTFFGIDDQKQLHNSIKQAIKEPLFHADKLNIFVFLNARGMRRAMSSVCRM